MSDPTVKFSDATGAERFAEFALKYSARQIFSDLTDSSELTYALTFSSEGARGAHQKLKAVEARQVLGGAPRMNLAGYLDAVSMSQGELVRLEFCLFDGSGAGETVVRTGIVTGVRFTLSGTSKQGRLDCIFQRCDRLHVRAFGAVTTLTYDEQGEA